MTGASAGPSALASEVLGFMHGGALPGGRGRMLGAGPLPFSAGFLPGVVAGLAGVVGDLPGVVGDLPGVKASLPFSAAFLAGVAAALGFSAGFLVAVGAVLEGHGDLGAASEVGGVLVPADVRSGGGSSKTSGRATDLPAAAEVPGAVFAGET